MHIREIKYFGENEMFLSHVSDPLIQKRSPIELRAFNSRPLSSRMPFSDLVFLNISHLCVVLAKQKPQR